MTNHPIARASIIDQQFQNAIEAIANETGCEPQVAAFDLITVSLLRMSSWLNDDIDPQSAWDELAQVLRRRPREGLLLGYHPQAHEFRGGQPEFCHGDH